MVDLERAVTRLARSCEDLATSRDRLAKELESALISALKQIEMLDLILQGKLPPDSDNGTSRRDKGDC